MKAYISYSLGENESYLVTALARQIRKEGFGVAGSTSPPPLIGNPKNGTLDYATQTAIASSDFIIGLVSKKGKALNRVYQEWDFAEKSGIPVISLVKKGVMQEKPYGAEVITVDHTNVQEAEASIKERQLPFLEVATVDTPESIDRPGDKAREFFWLTSSGILLAILPLFANAGEL